MAPTCVQPQGAPTHQLAIKDVFNRLSEREKVYAHHLSQAAWYGTRVILRQVSPEANDIFDLVVEIHNACAGNWESLAKETGVTDEDLSAFLDYAALFLSNIGNYFADGGKKIIPRLSADGFSRIAKISPAAISMLEKVVEPMLATSPSNFGHPSDSSQANYYPGEHPVTREEVALVAKVLETHKIEPENTRILKTKDGGKQVLHVLQASINRECVEEWHNVDSSSTIIRLEGGDHGEEISKICSSLLQAKEFAGNNTQAKLIEHYVASFRTGSLEAFRESQKVWVTDKSPSVEAIFGFVEPYRDPHGVRGEWEAIVCVSDPVESSRLKQLVKKSDTFIRLMPWAVPDVNNGKGPFEKDLFEPPDFASVHALASCSSIIWNGINLPNYNDIRENYGFKNVVVANRMSAENDVSSPCHYLRQSEIRRFKDCIYSISNITTAVHELLGHGTGKLLTEIRPGQYNFDKENPPINPLTGDQVKTWYLPGQTWTSVFGEIAPAVEECRAEVMSMYLMDNKELLSLFGYDDTTTITAEEVYYNTYLQIGVQGLQALEFYNADEKAWGEPHRSGQFAILKHLLNDGDGVLTIEHDAAAGNLTVNVDRNKLLSHGKPALGDLLCRIQIWRCIADFNPCSEFWASLSAVTGKYEKWRQIVCSKPEPRWKFVQANTILRDNNVEVKVYDESNEGIIQSWAEREV